MILTTEAAEQRTNSAMADVKDVLTAVKYVRINLRKVPRNSLLKVSMKKLRQRILLYRRIKQPKDRQFQQQSRRSTNHRGNITFYIELLEICKTFLLLKKPRT